MKGKIYTSEKCPVCNGALRHDENVDGFLCKNDPGHPKILPRTMIVKFGRAINKRFRRYDMARQFLGGLRFKESEGTFDARDYQKTNPLGFKVQADKWLKNKAGLSARYYANLVRWMDQAALAWGADTNIKVIGFGHIEDLILGVSVSDKTKSDMINCYSQFFKWLEKREGIPMPDMPEQKYKLGWRKLIDMETQGRIINEVKRICPNRRIWLGVKWLATYVAIRPKEMWSLKEHQIDVDGYFVLPPDSTKEGMPKLVPMLQEDIDLYNSLPVGLPNLPFFRRHKGKGVTRPGEQISSRAFYRWWKKACANLGIEGVDLYGGTRHSSVSAMGEYFTDAEIKKHATQHQTNKAFERYFRSDAAPKRAIYEQINQTRTQKSVGQ